MNTWVLDFHTGKDIVEAALANMQACSLLNVQRKRLYTLPEFAAAQHAHRTKVTCLSCPCLQHHLLKWQCCAPSPAAECTVLLVSLLLADLQLTVYTAAAAWR